LAKEELELDKSAPFDLKSVDQISYSVTDIDKTITAWESIYGMGPWTFRENGGLDAKGRPWKIRMAFTYVGNMQIELVQCIEGRIFQSKFSDKWGEGLHHVGFYVDDVDAMVRHLVSKGARLLIHDPGNFAYLDAGGPGGAIFEFMRRA
jgi:methylmalonyl-CoA/ethylmalonyl-CoA epimerase